MAHVAGIDDRAAIRGAGEKACHEVDRLLGRGETDPCRHPAGPFEAQGGKPFQRQSEMGAALVSGERMELVNDDGPYRTEHPAPRVGSQQQVERLRRRYEDVGWIAPHAGAFVRRCIAATYRRAQLDVGSAGLEEAVTDTGKRYLEILVNIVGQRLERRDVEDDGLVGQARLEGLADQRVDDGKKRGEGLARTGGRRDERRASVADRRPGGLLRLGRSLRELLPKPTRDRGVKHLQVHLFHDSRCCRLPYRGLTVSPRHEAPASRRYWATGRGTMPHSVVPPCAPDSGRCCRSAGHGTRRNGTAFKKRRSVRSEARSSA